LEAIEAEICSLARFSERCQRTREDGMFQLELSQLSLARRHARYLVIFTIHKITVHVLDMPWGATIDDEGRDRRPPAAGFSCGNTIGRLGNV
jgi:hypothetical protein